MMIAYALVFVAGLIYEGILAEKPSPEQTCSPEANELKSWSITVHRYHNVSGEWMDFSATGDWGNSPNSSNMGIKANLFECKGRKMIRLQGAIKDPFTFPQVPDLLRFHEKTGPNTNLTNNGYSAVKMDVLQSGVAFTHRPLKPNEIFAVRMNQRIIDKGYANGIGVTTLTPYDGDLPGHMNSLKNGTWMLFSSSVWSNGVIINHNYSNSSIYDLTVGDTLGVMRTEMGFLHFFINGVDQGPAASKIPPLVYGVYELFGDVTQVTVIHPS